MFSVIIPLYNKSAYIEQCLHSVLEQTFHQFEVIIINDGSTDNSADIVNEFISSVKSKENLASDEGHNLRNRNKFRLIHQPNTGVSAARNKGVQLANYDLIAFLDADDWWDDHFLEEMNILAESCPDAEVYASDCYFIKNGKKRTVGKGIPGDFGIGYLDYIKTYASQFVAPVNCSYVVVRKDKFLSAGGFNPGLKSGEDFDLWMRLLLKGKFAYVNKPLAFSNQDADVNQRALNKNKNWRPSVHFVFNLDHYIELESKNPEFKYFMDGIRIRNLIYFHVNNWNREEVSRILSQVDFSQHPGIYNRIYHYPRLIIKFQFLLLELGSIIKSRLYLLRKSVQQGNA